MHRGAACLLVACLNAVWLFIAGAGAVEMDRSTFAQKLERAAELDVSAPWRESQQVLDEIRPYLDLATEDQRAQFVYLDARHQSLAGDLAGGLERVKVHLEHDMSDRWRLRLLRLGANVAVIARRFEDTFTLLAEALALLEQNAGSAYDEGVYSVASYVYTRVGEIERGLRYGKLATQIAEHHGTLRDQCIAPQRVGYAYKMAGEIEAARTWYERGLENCRASGDELITGVTEAGLADLLRMHGEIDRALELFDSAMARLREADFESGLAEARLYRARLENARGNHAKVRDLLEPSLDQFEAEKNWDYLAEAHEMLAEIARGHGDLALALEHYDRHMAARERHLNMVRARQLAYLEVDFDLQHKEQQLALLREQARVSELEAETQRQRVRLTIFGYVIAGFLFLVLVLLLVHATRERRRFQGLSHLDGLTGVSNHTRFFERAGEELTDCRRGNLPFTLILGDIDHFKQVNDRFGHAFGDDILRLIGSRLRESFGNDGVIGRIGGEEFAIALPGMRTDDVQEPIEKFRQALSETRAEDMPMPITMSFGIAEPRNASETLTTMRERADQALYDAKRTGRDRVVQACA
ncbi:MAG: diguanylate cyclase [Wenzhouxiangellaceae bacterium]|nr:diguanylate cyclase [Wenzhouxiangellaceae bacterium]